METPDLVRTTPYFLLLSVGHLALFLIFIHMRKYGLKPRPFSSPKEKLPGVQFVFLLVLMLGFLTAFSGALGLVGLGMEHTHTASSAHAWIFAQEALEIIIKLALGGCVLYLLDRRILSRIFPETPINGKILSTHNAVLMFLLTCSTILSYISISIPFPMYPPAIVNLIACLIPLPLIVHFARRSGISPTVHPRVWVSLALVQLFGSISSCFSMAFGNMFAIFRATFLALWVGGMMVLFQMLHAPLITAPDETRPQTRSPSEDFDSLRDPFMSPPPVSPKGTLCPFPVADLDSRHTSMDAATLVGIPRTKSTTSLPQLRNVRTSSNLRESSQSSKRPSQRKSRQRRVNSEPMLPLTGLSRVHPQISQKRSQNLVDGSGE